MTNNQLKVVTFLRDENVKLRVNDLLKERAPQFITSLTTAVNDNKKLAECEPQSVLTAALTAASMNLPINQNLGFAYLIPYNNKSGMICQFQMGYKGFIQLAQRSGYYQTINVVDVRDGEIVRQDRLSGEIEFSWTDDEAERDKKRVLGYAAYFKLLNGFEKTLYWPVERCQRHAQKFSKNFAKYGSGLWKDDFDSMAKKTVLKQLISKYGPLSTELQDAITKDQTLDDEYLDNPNTPESIEITNAVIGESEEERNGQ